MADVGGGSRAKPMPRAKRHEQLLQVARRIIRQGGIGALTMSALAEESGASKPVVYEHFDNAESVAIALLETYFHTMIELVDLHTREAQTLDEYLAIAIDTQFEFHRKDELLVRSITNGHASGERLNAAYLNVRAVTLETLRDLVMQQGGALEESEVAAHVLWEMITSSVDEFAGRADAENAKEVLKRMVSGVIHAIVPGGGMKPLTPTRILGLVRPRK